MGQLNLRVLIEAVDRISRPMRSISRSVGPGLARSAKIGGMAVVSLGHDLRKMALMGGAAVVALSFAVFRLIKSTADAGDAALLAAQKTGVQIESYQRLAYAAGMAGVETTGFDDSLKFLNISIDAAGRGSKADARAFRQLGISIKDARGQVKPTEQLMVEIADRMATMDDGAQKTAIAMALFGRSGVDLIPMLNEGGDAIKRWGEEAQAAGLIMSEETARQADELNDSLDSLKGQVRGLGVSVATDLLPDLIKLVAWLKKMVAANKPEIVRQLQEALKGVAEAAPDVIRNVLAIVEVLGDIARVVGPLVRAIGGFSTVLDIMAGLMIGRVALAIWAATSAVMGLNAAMWANPIGLIIAGIAALVFAGWLLYRNWNNIVAGLKVVWSLYLKYCSTVWGAIKTGFKKAMGALWELLPAWLRMIFRGAAFTLRVIGQGLSGGPPRAPRPPPPPRPAVGPGRDRQDRLAVDLNLRGAPASLAGVRSTNPNHTVSTQYRGGVDGGD